MPAPQRLEAVWGPAAWSVDRIDHGRLFHQELIMQCDWIVPPGAGLGVRLEGLAKRFGERQVLERVDLDIAPGDFVAIVGRSGCGKSTLLRLLAGLESATAGEVRLDGAPLATHRGDIRIMFQEARLLPWRTVLQNVELGLAGRDARSRALQALSQVGLAERAGDWPAVLSGGQRQRVALARALVHRPRLLLLDEPLGALDALTRIEMQQLVESVWREHRFTALLVTHDVAEAVALADRVLLVEDGHVTLDEPVALARPRTHGSPAFADLEGRVLARVLRHPAREALVQDRSPVHGIGDAVAPGWRLAV
jgi:sulfonate transport system ATP-binding protein